MNVSKFDNQTAMKMICEVMKTHHFTLINDNRTVPYILFVPEFVGRVNARVYIHPDGGVGVELTFRTDNRINVTTDEFNISNSRQWHNAVLHMFEATTALIGDE